MTNAPLYCTDPRVPCIGGTSKDGGTTGEGPKSGHEGTS